MTLHSKKGWLVIHKQNTKIYGRHLNATTSILPIFFRFSNLSHSWTDSTSAAVSARVKLAHLLLEEKNEEEGIELVTSLKKRRVMILIITLHCIPYQLWYNYCLIYSWQLETSHTAYCVVNDTLLLKCA